MAVAFFETITPPLPQFDPGRTPLPWEEGLGQTVFNDVLLAEGPDGALLLRNLIAFPNAMTLSVLALFRQALAQGMGTRGHNSPTFGPAVSHGSIETGIVMFGLQFSDGSRYRNMDERGSAESLGSLQGTGRGFTGLHDFWAPLPPPGQLEVWVAWPAARVPETRTTLDASRIRDIAAAIAPLWS